MKYDLDLTFGEIFQDDPKAFLDQLVDIQKHQAKREESEKWVDRLRLIDISQVPDLTGEDGTLDAKWMSYSGSSQMMFTGRKERLVLPLLEKKDDDGEIPYVAVSWRWTKGKQLPQWGCDVRESYDYLIQRPGQEPHKSKFPDHYFERVIMYAQSQGIDRLWIDKECIYQQPDDDPTDLNLGVQIMDAVYGESTFSIGLLTTSLMHQQEIDLLAELLSGSIFRKADDTDNPRYKTGPSMETKLLKVQTLILRILSDSRWSRGWIFQEDHLASDRMRLLIPYSKSIDTDTVTRMYDFGKLPGNLIVPLPHFRKAVTMFCMASGESEHRWPVNEMLGKAKQYNIYNKQLNKVQPLPRNKHRVRVWTEGNMSGAKMNNEIHYLNEITYPSTTLSVLDDICHRDLEKAEDRIAIMANAAKFSTRLDTSPSSPLVASEAYSLSAMLLTLILLNGEILDTSTLFRQSSLMAYTLRQFLEEQQYRFNAPLLYYRQSFIDRCRLKSCKITDRGVEAEGFLFKLLPNRKPFASSSKPHPLKLTDRDRQRIDQLKANKDDAETIVPGQKFNSLAEEIITILITKLRKNYGNRCRLANYLEERLEWDRDQPPAEETLPSTPYVQDNMAGIVQALIDDRELRLARLDGEPETAQPSAIFIAPLRGDGWISEYITSILGDGIGGSWVFTSWDNGWRNHGMERLASIEVAPFKQEPSETLFNQGPVETLAHWDPEQADKSFLRSYGWVNGVWNVEGKRMGRFTFPINGLTSPIPPPIEDILGKRKRGDGSEEDGSEEDGSEEDGSEEDGSEEDGSEEDGSEEDGSEEDGSSDNSH
ncbi:hypothetical protein N0V86_006954 [Didymella sp. IMI 355093]|nr:hypothetical protein N0V86_006954 [Didymella sp. IMI 355093]